MESKANFGASFICSDNRIIMPQQRVLVHSIWDMEVFRRKLHGSTYSWDLISETRGNHNIVTNEGLNSILNIMFHNATQIATWYIAIFESNTTPAAGTTYATPVYTECTAYDELTREEYVEAASTAQSMTNAASKATFTMNASKTIYGASLVSFSTKNDTAEAGAVLYAAAAVTPQAVVSSDVIQITAVLTSADV